MTDRAAAVRDYFLTGYTGTAKTWTHVVREVSAAVAVTGMDDILVGLRQAYDAGFDLKRLPPGVRGSTAYAYAHDGLPASEWQPYHEWARGGSGRKTNEGV